MFLKSKDNNNKNNNKFIPNSNKNCHKIANYIMSHNNMINNKYMIKNMSLIYNTLKILIVINILNKYRGIIM
jgi:hypothetical protein